MEEQGGRACYRGWIPMRGVLVVFGGLLIHLTLGTQLTYGNTNPYFVSYIRKHSSPADLRYVDGIWIQACMQIGRGLTMFVGGMIEQKLGPKLACLTGSWILSAGVLMTYFTVQTNFLTSVLTYGVVFGIGCGIAYPTPITCALRWFPDHPGLICGLIFLGFGMGSIIFNQVITFYLNPANLLPDLKQHDDIYFTEEDVLGRVPGLFLMLGVTYATLQLVGVLLIQDPPELEHETEIIPHPMTKKYDSTSQVPVEPNCPCRTSPVQETNFDCSGQNNSETLYQNGTVDKNTDKPRESNSDVAPLEMLRTRQFYFLWFLFLFGGLGAIFMESMYKSYGQGFIKDDHFIATVGSCAAAVNSVGGIIWGHLADRYSFGVAGKVLFATFAATSFSLNGTEYGGKPYFLIWICLMMFAVAGKFTTMTAVVARMYGKKYMSINSGLLQTSQVLSAIFSALMAVSLMNYISYNGLLFIIGSASTIGFAMLFFWDARTSDGQLI